MSADQNQPQVTDTADSKQSSLSSLCLKPGGKTPSTFTKSRMKSSGGRGAKCATFEPSGNKWKAIAIIFKSTKRRRTGKIKEGKAVEKWRKKGCAESV